MVSIVLSNKIITIADKLFSRCSALTSIVIPKGVTTIGKYAFSNCSNLTSIVIPESVTSIASTAFYNCHALSVIYIVAKNQESYERVRALLPQNIQHKTQTCHEFRNRAITLLAAHKHGAGFFKVHNIPAEIIHYQLFILAQQYNIPPRMLQPASHRLVFNTDMTSNMDNKSNLSM